jgi:lysozyme family protein
MTAANFGPVMDEIYVSEGGYVDHPRDPGGATNMGITHITLADWRGKPVSKADVKGLTKREAGQIYRANYWNRVKGDQLPAGLDLVAMDGAVNSGVSRGAKWLQRGLGFTGKDVDGGIGPVTVRRAKEVRLDGAPAAIAAVQRACRARMGFLQGLRHWDAFGRGWSRRVARVEATAVSMVTTHPAEVMRSEGEAAGRAATQDRRTATAAGGGATATGGNEVTGAVETGIDVVMNPALIWVGVAALALVAVVFVLRGNFNADRAKAYAVKVEEMTDGE